MACSHSGAAVDDGAGQYAAVRSRTADLCGRSRDNRASSRRWTGLAEWQKDSSSLWRAESGLGKGTSRWWFLQCLALPKGLVMPQGAGMEQVAEGREV
jgi:hypothetical protein